MAKGTLLLQMAQQASAIGKKGKSVVRGKLQLPDYRRFSRLFRAAR